MSLGYEYGNTRLRAMKAKLIDQQLMRFLAESEDVEDFLLKLTKTDYKGSIEQASAQTSGRKIFNLVIRIHLHELFSRIRSFYDNPVSEMIDLILFRYEIHNIKTIFRGISQRVSIEEIQRTLISTGLIPLSILDILANQNDPIDLSAQIQFFDLPYAVVFKNFNIKEYENSLIGLETELERWYFREIESSNLLKRRFASGFEDAMRLEIDFLNLLAAFRFVGSNQSESLEMPAHFIPNGSISLEVLFTLTGSKQFPEVINILRNTTFEKALTSGVELYRKYWNLSDIEKSLRLYKLDWYKQIYKQDPLGIGVPLGFINFKQNELRNLLWIYKGLLNKFRFSTIINNLELVKF
jgi:vacuolar-type H+-ATPase subunit C/Vma6